MKLFMKIQLYSSQNCKVQIKAIKVLRDWNFLAFYRLTWPNVTCSDSNSCKCQQMFGQSRFEQSQFYKFTLFEPLVEKLDERYIQERLIFQIYFLSHYRPNLFSWFDYFPQELEGVEGYKILLGPTKSKIQDSDRK